MTARADGAPRWSAAHAPRERFTRWRHRGARGLSVSTDSPVVARSGLCVRSGAPSPRRCGVSPRRDTADILHSMSSTRAAAPSQRQNTGRTTYSYGLRMPIHEIEAAKEAAAAAGMSTHAWMCAQVRRALPEVNGHPTG